MAAASAALQGSFGLARPSPLAPVPLGPWLYMDEGRTHEVHAHVVQEGPGFRFVAREAPHGARDASASFESVARFREPWEAKFHLADLESRLASLGPYWRHAPPRAGWTRVHRNPSVPRVDLRPVDLGAASLPDATFHSFHHAAASKDRLLVAIPRSTRGAYALADLDFAFPRVQEGSLSLLHPCLAPAILRSLLGREHLRLRREGFDKLSSPADFALVYGPEWREKLTQAIHAAGDRVLSWSPEPDPEEAPSLQEAETAPMDYAAALSDPRLLALHRRFLRAGEEESLLSGGMPAIRRAIAAKRRAVAHSDQHRLSALEASLLARHALQAKTSVDPEATRILRRLDLLL